MKQSWCFDLHFEHLFVNAHNVGSTTIPLAKPGAYRTRAWVRAGVDENGMFVGYELYLDHVIEVTHIERAMHEAEQKLPRDPDSFDKFHDTMSVQTALLRPGDPDAQNRDHQFGVVSLAPNPSPISEGALVFSAFHARKDRSKPVTYHWYVSVQTRDKPPATLAGRAMVDVAGRRGYDFGVAMAIAMPAEHAGFWVVWYQAKDAAGHDVGEASYLQTILSGSDMKSLEKHDQYMAHIRRNWEAPEDASEQAVAAEAVDALFKVADAPRRVALVARVGQPPRHPAAAADPGRARHRRRRHARQPRALRKPGRLGERHAIAHGELGGARAVHRQRAVVLAIRTRPCQR